MQSSAGSNNSPYGRSIDEALPPDVWTEGLGRFAAYQRYPRYTWPWFRRRAYVLWPLAAINGVSFAIWHASSMTKWADIFPLGSRAVLAWLLTVSLGPLFAMFVRYRRWPYRVEVVAIVASVILGVVLSNLLQQWIADYHDMLMNRHCCNSMSVLSAVDSVSQWIAILMGRYPYWLMLFLVNGGWELRSYFWERRLLAEHKRRRDLDALRRDKADADLRLAVLQAQIEPHFLFNTLASLRTLSRTDPERTEATIDALTGYLRTTLPKLRDAGTQSPSLGDQIDICARYLDLMQIRIGERLRVVLDVSNELRAMAFPPLLLIPLVENAVKHGVEPIVRPVTIAIRARIVGTGSHRMVQVDVENDGAEMSESVGAGVGLANVRAQLEHRFGAEATLSIDNLQGGGVRSRITLPVNKR